MKNCSFRLLRFRPIAEISRAFLGPKQGHYSGVNLKIVETGPSSKRKTQTNPLQQILQPRGC